MNYRKLEEKLNSFLKSMVSEGKQTTKINEIAPGEKYEVFFDRGEQKYFIAIDTGMDYNEWRNGDTDEIIYYDTEQEAQLNCKEINKEFYLPYTEESINGLKNNLTKEDK